jgi:hypothetical protein
MRRYLLLLTLLLIPSIGQAQQVKINGTVNSGTGLTTASYDFTPCGGMNAEGLVGPGWYSDFGGDHGSITRNVTAADPDANHMCNLALITDTAGYETGIGMGHCADSSPSTACTNYEQSGHGAVPRLSSITFDSYFVFKNPAVLTGVRICVSYLSIGISPGCDQNDNPVQVVALQFSTNRSDTHWQYRVCDTSCNATSDSGVTPVASHWTCFRVRSTTAGTFLLSVGDSATSACSALSSETSYTTNLPTEPGVEPWFLVYQIDATAKTLVMNRWRFQKSVAP